MQAIHQLYHYLCKSILYSTLIYNNSDSDKVKNKAQGNHKYYDYHQGFGVDSISAEIAKSPRLQRILVMKSCEPYTTFILLLDFYSCIGLILSYQELTTIFLAGKSALLSWWLYLVLISIIYKSVREFSQMLTEHVRWLFSLRNYVDVAIVALVFTSVFQMLIGDESDKKNPESWIIITTTALIWLNLILFLRSTFMSFATFVGGISKIIRDLMSFIVISLLILMAFASIFRLSLLGKTGEDGECEIVQNRTDLDVSTKICSFMDSLAIIYGLMVQGIEIKHANSSIMVAFSFLVVIILLNVMIAIVSNKWEEAMTQSKEVVSITLYIMCNNLLSLKQLSTMPSLHIFFLS